MNRREFLWKFTGITVGAAIAPSLLVGGEKDDGRIPGYEVHEIGRRGESVFRQFTLPENHPGVKKDCVLMLDGRMVGVADSDIPPGGTGWVQVFGPREKIVVY